MFRSAVLAAAILAACPLPGGADTFEVSGDPVVRGRVEGVPGIRVKTLSATDAGAGVEISFGIQRFAPASASLDFEAPASRRPAARFYFDGSAATAAARVLVEVSRGSGAAAATPAAGAALTPDLAALCRVDPHARETMAEALASF